MSEDRNSPVLWVTLAATTLQVTILLYGALRFAGVISFCRSANKSGNYEVIKTIMMLLMYSYPPLVVISTTFSWVAYGQDWSAGYVFIWLPFVSIVLFFTVVMVTRNDISNFVDVQRAARGKLPFQPRPAPFVVGTNAASAPPALPIRGATVVDVDAL